MFQRAYLQVITTRILEPRRFIQVLAGPRQVGKTTLVTQFLAHTRTGYLFLSADDAGAAGTAWLLQQWQAARALMQREGQPDFLLIIDEIQKIENWSEVVKQLWDADTHAGRNLKVLLLGSSRLLLKRGLTESLAGRFETTYIGHWSYTEMRDAFGWDVNQYIWFGGYPGSAALISDEPRWKAYVSQSLIEASISKDILMLTHVAKPALMKRLFELGCIYSGQILSYTKMLGQLLDAGNTTTLATYLELLDTAGLLGGIDKFSYNLIRKRSSSPKFQVHNTALISAQRTETYDEILHKPEIWGRVVESAVGAHLIRAALESDFHVYYWRERNDEVDFILQRGDQLVAIEVKSNSAPVTASMNTFLKTYKTAKPLLVGDSGLSLDTFLQLNPRELF